MNSPMLLNATFFFVVYALLASRLPSARASNVMDTDGNPLKSGLVYYILPVDTGSGGGATLGAGKISNDTCSIDLVQAADDSSTGLPVRISDVGYNYHVMLNYPVTMQFVGNSIPSCVPSGAWWTRDGTYVYVSESSSLFSFGFVDLNTHTYYITPNDIDMCITSIDKNLLVSTSGKWEVKFKRDYSNSASDTWSIV
ncbi:hypothetical protein L6164_013281 [Bauhinia variegata]|uniref:Uncharacterized protein n=1 Tax=Bauhinia variegata TaxID=167791 RepID=A0ACB9PBM6_BAUVA|nr:hypothetical protein L6164_013281 [Bauhinia variegata]